MVPKKNRTCPYHGVCLSYGDCNDCDHGKMYDKLLKKVKKANAAAEAKYIVVEASTYDYDISVYGPFNSRKKAEKVIKQRFEYLLAYYGEKEDGDLRSCSEHGYNFSDGNETIYGKLKRLGETKGEI